MGNKHGKIKMNSQNKNCTNFFFFFVYFLNFNIDNHQSLVPTMYII